MLLTVTTHRCGAVHVVRAHGEIDMATAPLLAEPLTAMATAVADGETLAVDLLGVTFLGSVGLAALITAHHECQTRGARLVVVTTSRAVLRVLQVTGLTDVLTITDTVPDA